MKIIIFRGDLTDVSAKKEAMVTISSASLVLGGVTAHVGLVSPQKLLL